MAKLPKPYTIICRKDAQTFRITLNPSCGLPERVCREWRRRSLQHLPEELSVYRNPRRKSDAEAAAVALIAYFKQKQSERASWIKGRFPQWLESAGIKLGSRKIVPHSPRHFLTSLLEEKGIFLRYI